MTLRSFWFVALTLGMAGCAQQPAPVTGPSGEQAGYAERYPGRLGSVRARFAAEETKTRTHIGEFKGYPDALKNPDYLQVEQVYRKADEAGRSAAYTEAALEAETVERFFEEEKDPLRQKVGGSVSYAAKEKECKAEDLGSIAVVSMERGIDKQVEERLRDHSEAHRYIEDHQDELGKPNLDTLEKQADKVAHSSNVVHVRLELYRREVEALLGDASSVKATLDQTIQESDATLANASASKSKKALAQKRRTAAETAKNQLDTEVEQARRSVEEMSQRITALEKEYDTALDAVTQDLEQRAQKK